MAMQSFRMSRLLTASSGAIAAAMQAVGMERFLIQQKVKEQIAADYHLHKKENQRPQRRSRRGWIDKAPKEVSGWFKDAVNATSTYDHDLKRPKVDFVDPRADEYLHSAARRRRDEREAA